MVNRSEKSQRFKVTLYFWKKKKKKVYLHPNFYLFYEAEIAGEIENRIWALIHFAKFW